MNGGISADELANSVLPDENDLNVEWIEIARQSETLEDAAAAMRGTQYSLGLSHLGMEADSRLQEYEGRARQSLLQGGHQ